MSSNYIYVKNMFHMHRICMVFHLYVCENVSVNYDYLITVHHMCHICRVSLPYGLREHLFPHMCHLYGFSHVRICACKLHLRDNCAPQMGGRDGGREGEGREGERVHQNEQLATITIMIQ